MKNTKRQQDILRLLGDNPSMRVSELADFFMVTPTSIRRDLSCLESSHFIERSHGGAHLVNRPEVSNFSERASINPDEKKRIAAAAYQLILPRESILMDSGTTMVALAEEMAAHSDKYLSIVTNSIPVATCLSPNDRCQVTLTGGVVQSSNMSLIGPDADAFLEKIVADTAFIGSTGVHPSLGLTASSPFHVSVKRKMIQSATQVIALIDSSKFFSSGVTIFASFEQVSAIVTVRTAANSSCIDALIERGVRVILA